MLQDIAAVRPFLASAGSGRGGLQGRDLPKFGLLCPDHAAKTSLSHCLGTLEYSAHSCCLALFLI